MYEFKINFVGSFLFFLCLSIVDDILKRCTYIYIYYGQLCPVVTKVLFFIILQPHGTVCVYLWEENFIFLKCVVGKICFWQMKLTFSCNYLSSYEILTTYRFKLDFNHFQNWLNFHDLLIYRSNRLFYSVVVICYTFFNRLSEI